MNIVLFKNKIKLRTIAMIIFALFAIIFAIGTFVGLRIEYLEYMEIGENFVSVFWTNIKTKGILMLISSVVIYVAIYLTNIFIRRGLKNICVKENASYLKTPNKSLAIIIALIGGYIFATNNYATVLSCLNATWFNVNDPIFGKNIGYFIFQRPFYLMLVQSMSTLLVGIIIYTIAYYIVGLSILISEGIERKTLKDSSFIAHNFINIIMFLIVRVFGFYLGVENLVLSRFLETKVGEKLSYLVGSGFVNTNISRYVYIALPYITILCIIVSAILLRRNKIKKSAIALAVIPGVLILNGIVTGFTNTFIVSPNELEFERKYIEYNMEYTKQGYDLDIDEEVYNVKNELTPELVEANKQVIDNIRIVDYFSTLKVLNQYQTLKGYYNFNDSDIGVYDIDGVKTAVFISARELDQSLLKDKNYINKRFQYTHGYGLVINPVNSVDNNGYPNFIVKDITQNISSNGINITEPRIYYGELTMENVVVKANNIKEFDYPDEENNLEEYTYKGNAGIDLTFGNRVLMAIKNADPKLIYSQYIKDDSKLLINRNVVGRAKKIAPFLEYDNDPYLVITNEGKLVWVIDAYTTTNQYPYSQITTLDKTYDNGVPYKKELNYIRNSVKVLIDAYDGTTKFYIVDREDPIVMSYYKMYPELFVTLEEEISDDIWEHMRYPEYLFNMQSDILEKYHVENVDIFYRNEDLWSSATHNNGTKEEDMAPYYGLTDIDGKQEFALMQQYTPYNRKNMISWVAVKSNKQEYGKIKLYTFPKDSNIVGPMQLDNQIDQNSEISKDLSLWNTGGSSVIRSMVIVPVDNTLLYVEPIYLAAMNESQIPAIKKIVVSYGSNLAIADTFAEAMQKLLNQETIEITVENTETINGIIETLISNNNSMKEAAANQNWESYGTYLQKQDDLIKKLEKMQEENEKVEENVEE